MTPDTVLAPGAPPLFDNFVECRTRSQRTHLVLVAAKRAVKWLLNWKGARRPHR
jgi:hypothetical protein